MDHSLDIQKELKITVKTGKIILGSKRTIKALMLRKGVLAICSSNCPEEIKKRIHQYAKLSNLPIYTFPGTSLELGAALGKPFMVSALTIVDPGESEIIKIVEGG